MAATFTAMHQHTSCCSNSAAACTSAHISRILDTALLAVSIFVILIQSLLRIVQ